MAEQEKWQWQEPGRAWKGVGNATLLMAGQFMPVHVRSRMVKAAENGDAEPLRSYKNGCVLAARKGTVRSVLH